MKLTMSKNDGYGGTYWVHSHVNGRTEIFTLTSKRKAKKVMKKMAILYHLHERSPSQDDVFNYGLSRHIPEIVYEELKIPDEPVGNSHMANNHKEGKP